MKTDTRPRLMLTQRNGLTYFEVTENEIVNNIIRNWEEVKTIKKINGKVFIQKISLSYFLELLNKNKISFTLNSMLTLPR